MAETEKTWLNLTPIRKSGVWSAYKPTTDHKDTLYFVTSADKANEDKIGKLFYNNVDFTGIKEHQSLDDYYKKSEVYNKSEIDTTVTELENLIDEINGDGGALSDYVKSADLESTLEDYAKSADVTSEIETALTPYAKSADVTSKIETALTPYAKKSELPTTVAELEDAEDYATKAELEETKKFILGDGELNTAFDTLKEVSDWVVAHKTELDNFDGFENIIDTLAELTERIVNLERIVTP